MDLGVIVDVGIVSGGFVAASTDGRFVAMRDSDILTVYDVHNALTPTLSFRLDVSLDQCVVHPNGRSVVALTGDWTLSLWRAGIEKPITVPTAIAGSAAVTSQGSSGWGVLGAGWLQYTANGSRLYFGESVLGGPARLSLLDPVTLARLDTISPVYGFRPRDEPVLEWGEGVTSCCAPAPSTAVAFTANTGDDIHVLGVAEAVRDRLRMCPDGPSARTPSPWTRIPGERGIDIALLPNDELVVLDSDGWLTAIQWKDRSAPVRTLAVESDLLNIGDGQGQELAVRLRALTRDGEDDVLEIPGPVFAHDRRLAVVVERVRRTNRHIDQRPVALVIIDTVSGDGPGLLELPGAEKGGPLSFSNGTICRSVGTETRIARWIAPA